MKETDWSTFISEEWLSTFQVYYEWEKNCILKLNMIIPSGISQR